jgi:hypothetical protein
VCAFNQTKSTALSTSCYLSAVPTEYSVSQYAIKTPKVFYGTLFSSNPTQAAYLIDGNNNIGWTDASTTTCNFG